MEVEMEWGFTVFFFLLLCGQSKRPHQSHPADSWPQTFFASFLLFMSVPHSAISTVHEQRGRQLKRCTRRSEESTRTATDICVSKDGSGGKSRKPDRKWTAETRGTQSDAGGMWWSFVYRPQSHRVPGLCLEGRF